MKKALLDASSAILLYKVDLFEELTSAYYVSVSRSVLEELTRDNHHGSAAFLHDVSSKKIHVTDVKKVPAQSASSGISLSSLDQGELDTIICFEAGRHDFIITDDGRAARYCKENGLAFVNALLFPRLLYFADSISWQESSSKMDAIIRIGRYSSEVVEWARNCRKETLTFAIP